MCLWARGWAAGGGAPPRRIIQTHPGAHASLQGDRLALTGLVQRAVGRQDGEEPVRSAAHPCRHRRPVAHLHLGVQDDRPVDVFARVSHEVLRVTDSAPRQGSVGRIHPFQGEERTLGLPACPRHVVPGEVLRGGDPVTGRGLGTEHVQARLRGHHPAPILQLQAGGAALAGGRGGGKRVRQSRHALIVSFRADVCGDGP